jgi:hypothetical protein
MTSQHFGLVEELDMVLIVEGQTGKKWPIGLLRVHEHKRLGGCCHQGTRLPRHATVSEEVLM